LRAAVTFGTVSFGDANGWGSVVLPRCAAIGLNQGPDGTGGISLTRRGYAS
jgi:hypothetical protein